MTRSRLERRVQLLVISLATISVVAVSSIGWVILLDAEDAAYDRRFSALAAGLAAGSSPDPLPAGITAHPNTAFLRERLGLANPPEKAGLHDIFANEDLTHAVAIRSFADRLRLWFGLGYEREYRLWIAPSTTSGSVRVVLADLGAEEVSESAVAEATRSLLILGALLLALALGASHLITSWTLRPMRELTRQVLGKGAEGGLARHGADFPEDEIGQLAAALEDHRRRLHEALSRERHFLADCSHELRTPIATLRSTLDLAASPSENPAEHARLMGRLRRTCQRMERLVQTLLLLAREQAPQAEGSLVDIASLARQAADELVALHPGHPLRLSIECPSPVCLSIHGETLLVLCRNLIGNAYLHAGDGRLDILITRDDDGTSLVFQDDGPGFRTDASPRNPTGHGIGLSLVERLCSAHGWVFSLGRGPSGGARVTIVIPVAKASPPSS